MNVENNLYRALTDLGDFYPLNILIDENKLESELRSVNDQWRVYNPGDVNNNRFGLSLFSLNGETDGKIDLDSIRRYNIDNNEMLNEMSFRKATRNWKALSSISGNLKKFEPFMGRSHLIKMDQGGFFPPHRDLGGSFRLIAFIGCTVEYLSLILDGKLITFDPHKIYFLNTKLVHSLFSTIDGAMILVLNIEICEEAIDLVINHLEQY